MKTSHEDIFAHVGIRAKKSHQNETASLLSAFQNKDETHWQNEGARGALRIFRAASKHVPAYADFLKKNKVDPRQINTIEDFSKLPILTKHNYIEAYPLIDRVWQRKLDHYSIIATSSGTTGKPVFWPRSSVQEDEATIFHELLYEELFKIHQKSTLIIIGFPMGVYVSGVATLLPTSAVSALGHALTVISPGMNKQEIIRSMEYMSKHYDQTLLIGHPFFLKDVLETAAENGLPLRSYDLKLLSCSEAFNEEWRSYVSKLFSTKKIPQIFSTYGASELLLIGTETTFSVAVKSVLEKNSKTCTALFTTPVVPSLFQYNPLMRYIESEEGELLFTANSGVPLIRYALGDRGALFSYKEAKKLLPTSEMSLFSKWKLPLVALKGRSDNAVIFYGANIYVEHIHSALEQKTFLPYLTGKFRMRVVYSKRMDAVLEINVELREGVRQSKMLIQKLKQGVSKHLQHINMEYRSSVTHVDKDLTPQIHLHTYQSQPLFTPGMKTKFIIE